MSAKESHEFAGWLQRLRREAGIADQADFAARLGVSQQTVSRWERGVAIPQSRYVEGLARVLGRRSEEVRTAMEGANARTLIDPSVPVAVFDRPLPLLSLGAESFQRFCAMLFECRFRGFQVEQWGGPGHKQGGDDIRVSDNDARLLRVQCKCERQFGEARLRTTANEFEGDEGERVVALASRASPQVRALARTLGIQLWDVDDLSRQLRLLEARTDQIRIVDTFFAGQRFALIGVHEPNVWQTADDHFASFLKATNLFRHTWAVVGRDEELQSLALALSNVDVSVILLIGPGGSGKTRLLKESIDRFQRSAQKGPVFFARHDVEITPRDLDNLGRDEATLLAVDDAHVRQDLGRLLAHAADPANRTRVVLALRPHGRRTVIEQMARAGLVEPQRAEVELRPYVPAIARQVAEQVLKDVPNRAALVDAVVRHSSDTPLSTVLGAQVIQEVGVRALLLRDDERVREIILARFADSFVGGIAHGSADSILRKVVSLAALLQPLLPDDPAVLATLKAIEGVERDEAARAFRSLVEGGVLYKRGTHYRLAPDLLADSLLDERCITATGRSTGYAKRVFLATDGELAGNVLQNLSRLDWQRSGGDTSSSALLDELWSEIAASAVDDDAPFLKAAERAAYFQPTQAIALARQLVAAGHGTNKRVVRMLKNAAYTLDHLPAVLELLWEAGREDGRPQNQYPDHPIRVLTELTRPGPRTPDEVVAMAVEFAVSLLPIPDSWTRPSSPLVILTSALATEGHFTSSSTPRSVTISNYVVRRTEALYRTRMRAVDAILKTIESTHPVQARLAAEALEVALRAPFAPRHLEGLDGIEAELRSEALGILMRVRDLVKQTRLPATTLVAIVESIRWHTSHGLMEMRACCGEIESELGRDLKTRVIRLLLDPWGAKTWALDVENMSRPEFEEAANAAIRELRAEMKDDGEKLFDLLATCFAEARSANAAWQPALFINRLVEQTLPLARAILQRRNEARAADLTWSADVALVTLRHQVPEEAQQWMSTLATEGSDESLSILAGYFARDDQRSSYDEYDVELLRLLAGSILPRTAGYMGSVIRQVAKRDKDLAVDLSLRMNFDAKPQVLHDVFMWLFDAGGHSVAALSDAQLGRALGQLERLERLDDYWVQRFLMAACRRAPRAVVDLVKRRLDAAMKSDNWEFQPIEEGDQFTKSLALLDADEGPQLMHELFDWALPQIADYRFRHRFEELVSGLCYPFDERLVAAVDGWLLKTSPSDGAFDVVSAALSKAQRGFLFEYDEWVTRLFREARATSVKALASLEGALFESELSGVWHASLGEPSAEDIALRAKLEAKLAGMSRFVPGRQLYEQLLSHVNESIRRQCVEGEAIAAEEEWSAAGRQET